MGKESNQNISLYVFKTCWILLLRPTAFDDEFFWPLKSCYNCFPQNNWYFERGAGYIARNYWIPILVPIVANYTIQKRIQLLKERR